MQISFTAKLSYRNPIILTSICIIACDHTHKKLFVVLIRTRCFIGKELFLGDAVGMGCTCTYTPVKFKIIRFRKNTGNDVFLRIGFSHTPQGFLLLTNHIMDQCIPVGSDPDFLWQFYSFNCTCTSVLLLYADNTKICQKLASVVHWSKSIGSLQFTLEMLKFSRVIDGRDIVWSSSRITSLKTYEF